jgi:hypothetical protein
MGRLFWLGITLFYSVFFFVIHQDPFFGDAVSGNSRAIWAIYESDFSSLLFPYGYDPGHPTLIPLINALLWKITGPTVVTAHAINFSLAIGLCVLLFRMAKEIHSAKAAYYTVVLWSVAPIVMAQTAILNTHFALTFFFMLAFYAYRQNRFWWTSIAITCMVLTHLQSLYYLLPWVIYTLWAAYKKGTLKITFGHWLRLGVLPFIFFSLWIGYHYGQTGWALSSPDYASHRGFPGIKRAVVNLIISDWRIIDFGLIAVMAPLLYTLVKKGISSLSTPAKLFIVLYLFNAVFVSFTTGTGAAHRYFLPCLPLVFIWFGHFFSSLTTASKLIYAAVLLSGHFWFYPGKTVGDATLAYRQIFPLIEQYHTDYAGHTAHSYAPLGNKAKWMYANEKWPDIIPLYDKKLLDADIILKSNTSGDFLFGQQYILDSNFNWHSYQNGTIYLNIYVNKDTNIPLAATAQRKPTRAEKWIEKLKLKIKGDSGM